MTTYFTGLLYSWQYICISADFFHASNTLICKIVIVVYVKE